MRNCISILSTQLTIWMLLVCALILLNGSLLAQGVTTGAMNGLVSDEKGEALPGANVVAVHEPTRTQYGTAVRTGGAFTIPNMRVGGPYTVTVSFIGYKTQKEENIYVRLGQRIRLDFKLVEEAIEMETIQVVAEQDKVLNSGRTGAATYIDADQVAQMPSIKRSTRDLIRIDPRSDGNYSFGGKNWLYNNISLDGSYFNNAFGLDDPAVGGQTAAEPVPFDAVEQVQVSVAPFDVRQGGFTGANVNVVTKSGTNTFKGSAYTFVRNEDLLGNTVRGAKVVANPDLSFNQSGFTLSGPLIKDKLFFFVNGEIERRDDPGTNFVADRDGNVTIGESRVDFETMERINARMRDVYGYETGPFEGFVHATDNDKLIAKLDWNINENNNLTFRYNYLDAKRELPPHPFVFTVAGAGRGPNESSLPFQNTGYAINNNLHSFALEVNSRATKFANRFFASYNRFRDNRDPFSVDFPTIEIGQDGRTYTTIGHEPFSIHNILDQDVWQFTTNFSYFSGKHVITVGANFELFQFFNSFNIFRHGFPIEFASLDDFFAATNPSNPIDFKGMIGSGPFKGEVFDIGQLSIYAQDELLVSQNLTLTAGLRVDFPIYLTEPVDNPFVRDLPLLDKDGNISTGNVDQSDLPGAKPLFSPRVGFNWNVSGDRSTQIRGGTGIFTGRLPLVWIGNNISNPGSNPNLFPAISEAESKKTSDDAILQQSFFINAMDPDFKWPQVWSTNVAIDQKLPWDLLGTVEFLYSKDI
ncbi:MAG: carboxypeptidase regulatory-like domain-containing protein, partial [bacterium]